MIQDRKQPGPISVDPPKLNDLARLLWDAFVAPFRDPTGILLGSAIVALMLWGYHGKLELLGAVWDGWTGPGSDPAARARIIPGIAWDQEWLSFWAGALLVVGIPAIVIRYVFKRRLRDFGLGLPPPGLRRLALLCAIGLLTVSFGTFYLYGHDPAMAATYPFFRDFDGIGQFVVYEIGYLPFFLAIEFIFRGYLLFGMYLLPAPKAGAGRAGLPANLDWRILVPMLAYSAWHLGKPLPELWGTLVWGPATSAVALTTRSIWPIVIVHWLLNVWMDLVIWQQW
ncbi:CPBP family intramembrane metalloprotease [Oleomonas cavernae]|uniref:CPBP family intramembrane metalloprotease n=1 Tax=Oleomonas cavernae TaxID=2320859 RepID=A0A418VUH3_9PROT|nr:CPBP family intramembrane glutamic endopeptidase [Oleomonas cavernae]RJF80795.1 CPBP family intramembrane metalloprotease [Oleomonas cavernae]